MQEYLKRLPGYVRKKTREEICEDAAQAGAEQRMKEKEKYTKYMTISNTLLAVDGDDAHREWLKENAPPPKPPDSDDEGKSPRVTPYSDRNPEHYDLVIVQERLEQEQGQGKRKRELD